MYWPHGGNSLKDSVVRCSCLIMVRARETLVMVPVERDQVWKKRRREERKMRVWSALEVFSEMVEGMQKAAEWRGVLARCRDVMIGFGFGG